MVLLIYRLRLRPKGELGRRFASWVSVWLSIAFCRASCGAICCRSAGRYLIDELIDTSLILYFSRFLQANLVVLQVSVSGPSLLQHLYLYWIYGLLHSGHGWRLLVVYSGFKSSGLLRILNLNSVPIRVFTALIFF